jgi:Mg2+/Co2+ transporter CorB
METNTLVALVIAQLCLFGLSAFFSSSETAIMALNRYRLRHLAEKKHRGASRALKLLENPDGFIGFVLLGNNFVNVLLAQIATLVTLQLFGESAIWIASLVLTALILIFAEVIPKTFAALNPERVAYPATLVIIPLMTLLKPLVALINLTTRVLLKPFNVSTDRSQMDMIDREELRTVVKEAGALIPQKHRDMLFGILDLEKVTVEDIMVPRTDMTAIDLDQDWMDVREQLITCRHTRVPCYRGSVDEVVGILHLRSLTRLLRRNEELDLEELEALLTEPYYVPLKADLHTQLINFQMEKQRLALVVDEYGDLSGLVTLDDVLEQVVGEFTTVPQFSARGVQKQADGSLLVDGAANVRELNRAYGWTLPEEGAKTINGLIMESLEDIPDTGTSFRVRGYTIEILQTTAQGVRSARIFPPSEREGVELG